MPPLRRIRGFVEIFKEGYADKLDAEGLRLIQFIDASAEHMNTLIDALLRLAQFSRDQLMPQPTNLSMLVHVIGAELQQSDPTRRVEFVVAEDIMANGDPAMLRVVLENLLNNAWKFTSQQATARIEFGSMPQGDKTVANFVSEWRWVQHDVCRQALWRLPTLSQSRRVSRNRNRIGIGAAHRSSPRRTDLGTE